MSETNHQPTHEHAAVDWSEPFDPGRSYPGCGCHPKHAPPETEARQTYEAWARRQAAQHHAAKAAARAGAAGGADQPTQTNEEPR